jgi:hypothetical protein
MESLFKLNPKASSPTKNINVLIALSLDNLADWKNPAAKLTR